MSADDKLILYFAVFAVGVVLVSNPSCNRGCKTVAEHLLTDGLDGFLATLIG